MWRGGGVVVTLPIGQLAELREPGVTSRNLTDKKKKKIEPPRPLPPCQNQTPAVSAATLWRSEGGATNDHEGVSWLNEISSR